jgi:hypothetical protein
LQMLANKLFHENWSWGLHTRFGVIYRTGYGILYNAQVRMIPLESSPPFIVLLSITKFI